MSDASRLTVIALNSGTRAVSWSTSGNGTLVVAVEAGIGESFRRLVGRSGLVYGMSGFGESAPYKVLADHFGFTPEKLAAAVSERL